jgi:hypothetical protein
LAASALVETRMVSSFTSVPRWACARANGGKKVAIATAAIVNVEIIADRGFMTSRKPGVFVNLIME